MDDEDVEDTCVCASCAQEKPVSEFYVKRRHGVPVSNTRCKTCDLAHTAILMQQRRSRNGIRAQGLARVADRPGLLRDLEVIAIGDVATKYGIAKSTAYMWRRSTRAGRDIFARFAQT